MNRVALGLFTVLAAGGVALGCQRGSRTREDPALAAAQRAEPIQKADASSHGAAVMVVGSGTVIDGIFVPLRDQLSSLAGTSFETQDHGSGDALPSAAAPERQPAIAVRSSRARDADFLAAVQSKNTEAGVPTPNLEKDFRCVAAFVVAYDKIAFWVHADHPVQFIDLDKLTDFLFKQNDDRALPTWSAVGVVDPAWGKRKIAILMPRGPKKGAEDSGTRREMERLLSSSDDQRFSLEGQWLRLSETISKIPEDVEKQTSDAVAPMGLASAAFVGSSKVRPLAIIDRARHRNVESGPRALWAYVLVPKSAPVSNAVLRIVAALLSDGIQGDFEARHFRRISEALRTQESQTLDDLRAGNCAGRSVGGVTIVEPEEDLLAK
jgi:ABC-type phosphate transport system substrate-binding protein